MRPRDHERVVVFTFAGRRPNMELQLPLMRRILAEHPNVEFHVWNLARKADDVAYVNSLTGERIIVHDDYPREATLGQSATPLGPVIDIYRRYAADEDYADCVFVKMDDDVVFLETARFAAFLEVIGAHPGAVVSADVVNNEAACAAVQPALWAKFAALGMPLAEWHNSIDVADLAHQHFFDNHAGLWGQPIELVPTGTWLSVNAVGYGWPVARRIAELMQWQQQTYPALVAGRPWEGTDEAVLNLFDKIVVRGFTAAHLTFWAQDFDGHKRWGPAGYAGVLESWRERYRQAGRRYLESAPPAKDHCLPGLSSRSYVDWCDSVQPEPAPPCGPALAVWGD